MTINFLALALEDDLRELDRLFTAGKVGAEEYLRVSQLLEDRKQFATSTVLAAAA